MERPLRPLAGWLITVQIIENNILISCAPMLGKGHSCLSKVRHSRFIGLRAQSLLHLVQSELRIRLGAGKPAGVER